MKNLQRLAGISAISEALIYIVAFVYFGVFWSYPSTGSPTEKMAYLAQNHLAFSTIYFLMYIVFGVFLAVLVIGLYEKLKHTKNPANPPPPLPERHARERLPREEKRKRRENPVKNIKSPTN